MIRGKITTEVKSSDEFSPNGTTSFLIWGDGQVQILRAVGDSAFFPITDKSGSPVVFENESTGGVICNIDLINHNRVNKFKIIGDTATEIEYKVSWGF